VYILHSFQNPETRRSILALILNTDLRLRCNRESHNKLTDEKTSCNGMSGQEVTST